MRIKIPKWIWVTMAVAVGIILLPLTLILSFVVCFVIALPPYRDIPTDEEMILNFFKHETAFDELCDIACQQHTTSSVDCFRHYPPFDGDDDDCFEGLSENDKSRLDSLLAVVGSERIFLYLVWPWYDPEAEVPNTSVCVHYFSRGLSIGGTSKNYIYEPKSNRNSMPLVDSSVDMNDIYDCRDTTLHKFLKEHWFIELQHDN